MSIQTEKPENTGNIPGGKGYFDLLRTFLNREDKFAASIGARIVEISPGYARAEMEITEQHLNGAKVVQGGAIFTLADFAFAGGSNSYGPRSTAMNSSITFMRPGTGKKLIAEARAVNRGRRTCLFDVTISSDQGKNIAKMMINGFLFEGESVLGEKNGIS